LKVEYARFAASAGAQRQPPADARHALLVSRVGLRERPPPFASMRRRLVVPARHAGALPETRHVDALSSTAYVPLVKGICTQRCVLSWSMFHGSFFIFEAT